MVLRIVIDSLRGFSARAGTITEAHPPIPRRDCQRFYSHANLDDRALLDLLEPRLHAGVVFLPVEDLAHLLAHALERFAVQRLFRFQPEDVIAELRPIGTGDFPRSQREDLVLDLLGQLAPAQRAE